MEMVKVTFVQRDFDGRGNDRTFNEWVRPGQLALHIERKGRAFNQEHTDLFVDDQPREW